MSNAIVMNTLTGAVSEYTAWQFDSVAGSNAGSADGFFDLGGALDDGDPIVAEVNTGKRLWGTSLKKTLEIVYFSLAGEGRGELVVQGATVEYAYPVQIRPSGQSRAKPGAGIRENYLAFGYRNPDGDPFTLDRMEVLVKESKTRRVG